MDTLPFKKRVDGKSNSDLVLPFIFQVG